MAAVGAVLSLHVRWSQFGVVLAHLTILITALVTFCCCPPVSCPLPHTYSKQHELTAAFGLAQRVAAVDAVLSVDPAYIANLNGSMPPTPSAAAAGGGGGGGGAVGMLPPLASGPIAAGWDPTSGGDGALF